MKFGPRRGHFLFIFERFFRDFGLLVAAVVVALVLHDYQRLLENIPLVIVVFFAPVTRTIQYFCTYYSIDDEKLLVESGWLKKKRREIPLSNITTVDFTQNLVFQLFKVYSVNVDNAGSISGDSAKVRMAFKMKEAIEVKNMLLAKRQETAEQDFSEARKDLQDSKDLLRDDRISEDASGNTILATAGELFLMGILRAKGLIMVQVLAYGGVAISIVSNLFLSKNVDGQQLMLDYFLSITAPLLIAAWIIACYLLGIAISVVLTVIRYYGFRVTDRGNSIFIEYGLLTKKTCTLLKEKISGVAYRQAPLMRIFGRGTLEVFAVGYGNDAEDSQQVAILYPVLRKEKTYAFLSRLLPEMEEAEGWIKTEPKALPYFFICGRFAFAAVLAFAAALVLQFWHMAPLAERALLVVCLLIFAAVCVSVILEYQNTAVAGNERLITLTCGGYTRQTVLLKTEKVEYVEERATLRKKRRKEITTIRLGILAPAAVSHQKVRNVGLEAFEKIKGELIY